MHTRYKLLSIANRLLLRRNMVLTPTLYQQERGHSLDLLDYGHDFIRMALIKQIVLHLDRSNVSGAFAELGVYQGSTSSYINALSPKRRLYLLDTFTGFDERDLGTEREQRFSAAKQEFQDTSVEAVMARMPHAEQCTVIRGFFPQSVEDFSDPVSFAFAIIDVDLYEPILAGLNWFWPRLSSGGAILVHDYGSPKFKGARKAVREFAEENGISYVPLPDTAGSAVMTKACQRAF